MSITANHIPNQAIRCGDRNHKASIARQRANAVRNPVSDAEQLAKIVRERMSVGQPLGAGFFRNLPEDTWSELMAIVTPDELAAINQAIDSALSVYDPVDAPTETTPEPQAESHTPTWHDHNAPLTHHLEWIDPENCKHGLTIRADNLDDMLRQLTQVKALIASARHKAAKDASANSEQPQQQLSSRRCELHNSDMVKAISKKTNRPYAFHWDENGERCFGKKRAA